MNNTERTVAATDLGAAMLVSYGVDEPTIGVLVDGVVADLDAASGMSSRNDATLTMNVVIDDWRYWSPIVQRLALALREQTAEIGQPATAVQLRAPIPRPRRNPFLIAGNYRAHVEAGERATGVPLSQRKQAIFFTKPSGTVIGPDDEILVDPGVTQQVDYENELVVVIGRGGRDITPDVAMDFVFGYMIGNDVSARDIQLVKPTTDFLRGKGLDTFFPTGPGIVLRDGFPHRHERTLRTFVNGSLRQEAILGDMTRDVPQIIADLSRGLSLEPGDIIATGTPSGVQVESPSPEWLRDGDVVACQIEGIGTLVNTVREIV